ncbi:hypothetical protein RJT34_10200 [Clitoria ternatea]|uniref:Uncharacterized protein n=1 Tax=Clitoria ternatea TaxID=43366 RepID=A0AAN9PWY0_CLITE
MLIIPCFFFPFRPMKGRISAPSWIKYRITVNVAIQVQPFSLNSHLTRFILLILFRFALNIPLNNDC